MLATKDVDWPLAVVLAVAFVVMSVARWRYFQARARRRARRQREGRPPG